MRNVIIQCLFILVLVTTAMAAEKQLGMQEYTSVDRLAKAVTSYFPRIQGEVKAVAGDRLTIDLGTQDGLQKGVLLTVWTEGKEIHHPITNAVIGHLEDEVGTLEVTDVGEATSTGVMTTKLKEPKVGDKARITPKKITLGVIPLQAEHPEILQGLVDGLKESGRFTVLDSEKAAAFLNDKKQRDASLIQNMGKTFNLDVVLTVEVHPSDGKYLVTTELFYTGDTRPLDTIVALLDLRAKKDTLGEVNPFFAPQHEMKMDIEDLPFNARLFAAADLEGTGSLQYVFSDGARLHIFKQRPSGWREEWVETIAYEPSEMVHINIDVADINGNGRPEIFVTGMLNGKVVSSVTEFKDGVYQRISELPGFLRVVATSNKASTLIGQAYDPVSFFAGNPKRYVWLDGSYVPTADFPLPKGVGLYGFAFAEAGEAVPLLVALDSTDHLVVYANGVSIWKSEERYPTIGTTVIKPLTGIDVALNPSVEVDKTRKVKISGRVCTVDLNGDARDEVLVPKNIGETILTPARAAEFIDLGWTGARLDQRWSIKDIPGVVLDYQVIHRQGSGDQILAVVMTPGGLFSADRYRLISYSTK
jgi:hypothetical protein